MFFLLQFKVPTGWSTCQHVAESFQLSFLAMASWQSCLLGRSKRPVHKKLEGEKIALDFLRSSSGHRLSTEKKKKHDFDVYNRNNSLVSLSTWVSAKCCNVKFKRCVDHWNWFWHLILCKFKILFQVNDTFVFDFVSLQEIVSLFYATSSVKLWGPF